MGRRGPGYAVVLQSKKKGRDKETYRKVLLRTYNSALLLLFRVALFLGPASRSCGGYFGILIPSYVPLVRALQDRRFDGDEEILPLHRQYCLRFTDSLDVLWLYGSRLHQGNDRVLERFRRIKKQAINVFCGKGRVK